MSFAAGGNDWLHELPMIAVEGVNDIVVVVVVW